MPPRAESGASADVLLRAGAGGPGPRYGPGRRAMANPPRRAGHRLAQGGPPIRVVEASASADLKVARDLIREYARSLDIDLEFQDFEGELASFPGVYAPPSGRILLARVRGRPAGVVALRAQPDGSCEMKRLYVRPRFRGRGIGRRLAEEIVGRAVRLGYRTMRLDTLASMEAALGLYHELGFRDIAPYRFNPIAGARFLELDLRETATPAGLVGRPGDPLGTSPVDGDPRAKGRSSRRWACPPRGRRGSHPSSARDGRAGRPRFAK